MDSGMQRSYDCPECGQAAFIVVRRPDILRCLYCQCQWESAPPPPDGSREGGPVSDDACDR
jgi:hypothetical protein